MRKHVLVISLIWTISAAFPGASAPQTDNPQLVPILRGLLQKYKGCILERYETQQDMRNRGLDGRLSGLSNTNGLHDRDVVTCVAGNRCSLSFRRATYNMLLAQANRGDPTNFQTNLEKAIPADCFQCQKHQEWHTKHVHCTMECGGNNGLFQGPCFEGCKAGVDITKLVNDVVNDIGGVLQGLGVVGPAETQATGGLTVATNFKYVMPPRETLYCEPDAQRMLAQQHYFIAPRDMLDWTPTQSRGDYTFLGFRPPQPATPAMYNSAPGTVVGAPGSTLGANEGRLRAELSAAASNKKPLSDLCQAAQKFTHNQPASADTPSDHDFGNAFADLSVTGKAAFAQFMELHPTETSLRGNAECVGASDAAITTALDRAYRVAAALRTPHRSRARQALKWIAVSGEDDQPYRPVNVPSTDFPQFLLKVDVPKFNIAVNTRYMIAHAPGKAPNFVRPATPLVDGGPRRQVPADPLPALAPDAQVILFITGMDSRLEEADDLTAALHRLGGRNWTVISMDLPTSGYADNIDHQRISPISAVACHYTPVVDFIEEFIVAFVDTLDGQLHGQLKPRIKAVVGGSLGGNMSMRLGRRPNTPWITNVVPWSPAAIWPSMINQRNKVNMGCDTGGDIAKDRGVNQALKWGGLEPRFLPDPNKTPHETPELRRELFYGGFDWDGGDLVAIFSGNNHKPQAECWFANDWPCKKANIVAARLDRQETYDANFRAWHWRLGAEQLAFSQQQFAPGTKEPLYLLNTKRMLLFCGMEDVCADLCKDTRDVAAKMVYTPGYARFLQHTGHSLDNEHPDWVARQIADFLR